MPTSHSSSTVIEVSPPLYPRECGNPDCTLTVEEVESWFSRLVPHRRVLAPLRSQHFDSFVQL